ncbi:DUF4097 family beta strand repeat-containing protein [Arcanobacterium pinnipediorum]|uniref:DUF4097 domain-containing protein n=1 Tax=Arcanobacterium pinnipediorum TaxID=1503041 RepID=A0ABY5AH96_9ACTO|nr:DUF4097 family beta strand repeat-containing protein [Arcanobacterium pinnipediorum]USR78856.1 DUF4097 domain-containing protein [Arcanobacterium pinnipediorum]
MQTFISLRSFDLKIRRDESLTEPHVELPADAQSIYVDIAASSVRIDEPKSGGHSGWLNRNSAEHHDEPIILTLPSDIMGGEITCSAGSITTDVAVSHLKIKVGAGDIFAGKVTASSIKSGAGTIKIGQLDSSEVKNGAGAIDVERLTTEGDSSLKSGAGDVVVATIVGGQTAHNVSLKTGVGSIRAGIAQGTATYLDLKSGLGKVSSELAQTDVPRADVHKVRIEGKAGTGAIEIYRAVQ